MQVSYVNGTRFRAVLIAGGINLIDREQHLNDINVFPVPDGDTGTNMSGTIEEILSVLVELKQTNLGKVSKIVAETALMGAKGNSGTIIAQFFQGLSVAFKDQARVTTHFFAKAAKEAVGYTYKAVTNPREGTILTVLREWSDEFLYQSKKSKDFVAVHQAALKKAHVALKKTPDQLAVLKKAKVVDAGAQGFVDLLEGVSHFIKRSKLREFYQSLIKDLKFKTRQKISSSVFKQETELTFRYCCEFIIKGENIQLEKLRQRLMPLGDSLIVAGCSQLTKIHIHSDDPYQIRKLVGSYGSVEKSKVDDMQKQVHSAHQPEGECAIVIDSSCDLNQNEIEKLGIHVVSLTVQLGKEKFLDGQTISKQQFYKLVQQNHRAEMKTAAPSVGQFLTKFKFLKNHYRSILFLSISESASSTMQNAITAASMLKDRDPEYHIEVVNSKSGSVGIGLLAREVALAAESGKKIDELVRFLDEKIASIKIYTTLYNLDRLIRGGRLPYVLVRFLQFFRLRPLLTNNSDGVIAKEGFYIGKRKGKKVLLKKICDAVALGGQFEWHIGHVDNEKDALWIQKRMKIVVQENDPIIISEIGPTMTCHAGTGSLVIAYLPR